MIERIEIKNNKNTPLHYLSKLKAFKNGKKYFFKEGVNIIVGENGCGKTTLLNLIKRYLLVDYTECSIGDYNSNINKLFKGFHHKDFLDGVDVYADYTKNTFRLCHAGERSDDGILKDFNTFSEFLNQTNSSTGESVLVALNSLFQYMFSKDAKLKFDYSQFNNDNYGNYYNYIKEHTIEGNEYTVLMDEPDRNLSLKNIQSIKNILSIHKPQTQIIAVIHNPLLIYSLSKNKEINFIELSKNYIKEVKTEVESLLNDNYRNFDIKKNQ